MTAMHIERASQPSSAGPLFLSSPPHFGLGSCLSEGGGGVEPRVTIRYPKPHINRTSG